MMSIQHGGSRGGTGREGSICADPRATFYSFTFCSEYVTYTPVSGGILLKDVPFNTLIKLSF